MKTVATTLRVARSNLVARSLKVQPFAHNAAEISLPSLPKVSPAGDAILLPRIEQLVGERPSYGYRRVTAMLNRLPPADADQPQTGVPPHAQAQIAA